MSKIIFKVIDIPSDGEVLELPSGTYAKDTHLIGDKLLIAVAEYKQDTGSSKESPQSIRNKFMLLWEKVYIRDNLESKDQLSNSKEAMKRFLYTRYGSKFPSKLNGTELTDAVKFLQNELDEGRTIDVKNIKL